MLQKLWKCEVLRPTVWKFKNLIATQFYEKLILGKLESQKCYFYNFRHSEFWYGNWKMAQIYQYPNSEPLKLPKMTFFDCLNLPKFDFTQNRSGCKMIELQRSQALHNFIFWKFLEHSASLYICHVRNQLLKIFYKSHFKMLQKLCL